MRLLPVLAMLACNPTGTATVGPAPDTTDTTDTNGNNGGNDTTDTADTADPQDTEDTIPYPLTWNGTREIIFEGYCEDTIYEEGEEVTRDEDYGVLMDACPTCSHIFEASTDPDSICQGYVGVSSTIYRGIIRNEQDVTVVLFSNSDGDWEISIEATGEIDENMLYYEYVGEYNGYDYTAIGEVELYE